MAIGFCATAQKSEQPLKFSVGLEAGLPVGDFKQLSSFGIGGSVQGEYAAAETVGATLSAGFMTFPGKDLGGLKVSTRFIPVLAGAKVYFAEKFFFHGQLGITFASSKVTSDGESESGSTSGFTYAPGFGVKASENFDVELKYQAFSKSGTLGFFGLRAAYNF